MQNILGIAAVLAIGPLVMLAAEAENKTAETPRDVNSVELRRSEWKFGTAWKMVPGLGRKGGEALVCEKTPEVKGGGIATCRFPVKPGASYRFGAMTKLEKGGKGVTPRFGIRWCDSKGKGIKSYSADVVTDNDPDTRGWTRVEGMSGIVPKNAASGMVLCWMSKMEDCRALIGEMFVTQTPSEPAGYLQCSSYKNAFSDDDGDIRFAAVLNLNIVLNSMSDYGCEVEFLGADGKKAVRGFVPKSPTELEFSLPAKAFANARQDVVLRVLLKGKTAGETRCRIVKTAKPVTRRVMFDRYGRTILDGKPFFPLGMFTGRMTQAERKAYSEGPFNFVMHYGLLNRKQLDEYAKMGVYAAMDSRSLVYGYNYGVKSKYRTLEESKKAIREKFAEIGDHPAFMSWYLVDECPQSQFKNVRDVNEFLHEFDPDHPTYAVTDKPWHVRPMMPCFDVLGIDPYPVGNRGVRADISICSGWVRTAVEGMFGMRPMWHVPQVFNWGWFRKEDASLPNVRMPSRHEMANMTWQGIAAGANGLCAYSFTQVQRQLKGEELKRTWAEVVSVAREIKSFEKVLLSAGTPIVVGGVPDSMEVRAYDCDGEPWVLAVNRTLKPVKAVLKLPRRFGGIEVKVGKGVSLKGKELVVDMQGLDYAFLRLDPK